MALFIREVHEEGGGDGYAARAISALHRAFDGLASQLELIDFDVIDREPVVYYLQRLDGMIKIGYTNNIHNRKSSLGRRHGPLRLLAWETGGFDQEQIRHRQFPALMIDPPSEWFRPGGRLLVHISSLAAIARSRGMGEFSYGRTGLPRPGLGL